MLAGIWQKLHGFGCWLSQSMITLFYWTGYFFTFWLPAKLIGLDIIPREADVEDKHTFRHFANSMAGTLFFYWVCNCSMLLSAVISFGLGWLIWEVLVDGILKASDMRGYQTSDVGADFWGAILPVLIYYLGKL